MNNEIINQNDEFQLKKIIDNINFYKKILKVVYVVCAFLSLLIGIFQIDNLEEFFWPIRFIFYLSLICFIILFWFLGTKLIKYFFKDLTSYYEKNFFSKKKSFKIMLGIYYCAFIFQIGILFFSLYGFVCLIILL